MKFDFGEIREDVLVPLVVRARETQRNKPRIRDEKAAEVVASLDIGKASRYNKPLLHEAIVARTIMVDNAVKTLLLQYPDAVCVNMGCGFDDRFSRVDNGQITWYDVDRPAQIAARRMFFPPRNRVYLVQSDKADIGWTRYVPKCKPVVAIADGLFERFDERQLRECLDALATSFPAGTLVVAPARSTRAEKKHMAEQEPHRAEPSGSADEAAKGRTPIEALDPRFKLVRKEAFAKEAKRNAAYGKARSALSRGLHVRIAIFTWG